jgi:hypothetical protein
LIEPELEKAKEEKEMPESDRLTEEEGRYLLSYLPEVDGAGYRSG